MEYYKSPKEFIPGENDLLKSTKFVINKPANDPLAPHKVEPTDETVTENNELVILSIGYQGSPIQGFEELGIWYEKIDFKIKVAEYYPLNQRIKTNIMLFSNLVGMLLDGSRMDLKVQLLQQ